MNADELRAVSEMVANLTTDLYNTVKQAHDRVTTVDERVAALEQWGAQVNGAIEELAERIGALQTFVVENVASGVYESEVTEHYRRFVVEEAARLDVTLAELRKAVRGQRVQGGSGGGGGGVEGDPHPR